MDEFGVLDRLIFDQAAVGNAEPIARLLGMVHLYRASGVHLLAFFAVLEMTVEWVFKTWGLKVERSKLLVLILCSFAIFWIWKLQAFRVTLIRPILTFLIRLFFKERGAKARIGIPLALTFISEWIISRQTPLSEGALHYYFSVGGGLLAYELYRNHSGLKRHLALAVGSWLPFAVIGLYRDHLISYLTPLYSLVSIPVISGFLYPLTLFDLLIHEKISDGTIALWNLFLKGLFWLPTLGPTFATISSPAVYLSFLIALSFAVFWKKWSHRYWILSLGLIFSATLGRAYAESCVPAFEVAQIDVHQGDAAALKKGNIRTEMIDVGSAKIYPPDEWILKLSRLGISSVDGILLSHLDEDHCGALKEILLLTPVKCVETHPSHWLSDKGLRLQNWMREHAPEVVRSGPGCVLLPKIAWFKSTRSGSDGNDLMAGTVFAPNNHEAYFALGDGDEEQELTYEKYFHDEISNHPFRIWKISHHGSRFSSNLGFLTRLDPKEFWISVGKHNPYHHPNPLTLFKLSGLSGKIYRTDVDGDVIRSFKE